MHKFRKILYHRKGPCVIYWGLNVRILIRKDTSIDGEEKPFYEEEENEEDESDEEVKAKKDEAKNKPQMDPDHALLLKNSRPLLQSRNASVCGRQSFYGIIM